jgi:hypothetical protein
MGVKETQTVFGSNNYLFRKAVPDKGIPPDKITGNQCRVIFIMLEYPDRYSIPAAQSFVGGKPHETQIIFNN